MGLFMHFYMLTGKLLSEVQSDPDFARQASVKKRVAQYISKAEQLGRYPLGVARFYFIRKVGTHLTLICDGKS